MYHQDVKKDILLGLHWAKGVCAAVVGALSILSPFLKSQQDV